MRECELASKSEFNLREKQFKKDMRSNLKDNVSNSSTILPIDKVALFFHFIIDIRSILCFKWFLPLLKIWWNNYYSNSKKPYYWVLIFHESYFLGIGVYGRQLEVLKECREHHFNCLDVLFFPHNGTSISFLRTSV